MSCVSLRLTLSKRNQQRHPVMFSFFRKPTELWYYQITTPSAGSKAVPAGITVFHFCTFPGGPRSRKESLKMHGRDNRTQNGGGGLLKTTTWGALIALSLIVSAWGFTGHWLDSKRTVTT